MKDRVLQELSRIESQHGVRILLGVESGSRAWGFASPDSDYDVRFIYVHEEAWYLSVFERRDVIEEMLPERLDINGWDLRKTLRLFSKCNLALNEWLGSPITYSEIPGFRNRLLQLIADHFNPIAANASLSEHGRSCDR
jgi:predicted nucleotidyltransferase